MIKQLFFALFFTVLSVNAQDTIRVNLEPNNNAYKWMMLYKVKGAKQEYISNSTSENNTFSLTIPEGKKPGMYRLMYDLENGGYFDFLYNQASISVTFNPQLPDQTAKFKDSEENALFQSYVNSIIEKQTKLDSIQLAYFDSKDSTLVNLYAHRLEALNAIQTHFEKESEGKMSNDFIKVTKKYNSPTLLKTPNDYLQSIQTHFFDYIDFGNQSLTNSSIFVDKVIEYVFYINSSEDAEMDNDIKKKAIEQALLKIGDKELIKNEVLSSLLYTFAGQENLKMADFVKGKYLELSEKNRDSNFINDIDKMLSLAIGRVAPEITWKEDGVQKSLINLDGADTYLVVFWSTTCSHCLAEIPEVYKFTKDKANLKVVAVALEEDKFGFEHHTEMMDKWINVLGLNKWENEFARRYEIHATPSYFVLDKDKKIIAKPEQLVDLLHLLGEKKEVLEEVSKKLSKE